MEKIDSMDKLQKVLGIADTIAEEEANKDNPTIPKNYVLGLINKRERLKEIGYSK